MPPFFSFVGQNISPCIRDVIVVRKKNIGYFKTVQIHFQCDIDKMHSFFRDPSAIGDYGCQADNGTAEEVDAVFFRAEIDRIQNAL